MKRIDSRTVELTLDEQAMKDRFEMVLDTGLGIKDAAVQVIGEAKQLGIALSPAFVTYLSDGTVQP